MFTIFYTAGIHQAVMAGGEELESPFTESKPAELTDCSNPQYVNDRPKAYALSRIILLTGL